MKKLCIVASALGLFASADLMASDVPGADELSPQDAQKATLSGFYGALGIGGNFEESKLTANSVKDKSGKPLGEKAEGGKGLSDEDKKKLEALEAKTPAEVEEEAIAEYGKNAWDSITQDKESGVNADDGGNIDDIFGPGARFLGDGEEEADNHTYICLVRVGPDGKPVNPDGSAMLNYQDTKPTMLADGVYDPVNYPVLGGKAVWDAAVAVNNANCAYEGGHYGDYKNLAKEAAAKLRAIKWTEDDWNKALDVWYINGNTPKDQAPWSNEKAVEIAMAYEAVATGIAEDQKRHTDEIKKLQDQAKAGGTGGGTDSPSKGKELKCSIKAAGLSKGSFLGIVAIGYGRFFNNFYAGLEGLVEFGNKTEKNNSFVGVINGKDYFKDTENRIQHGQVTPVIAARIGYYIDGIGLLPYLKLGCAFTRTTATVDSSELKMSKGVLELDLGIEKTLTRRSSIRAEVGYRFNTKTTGDLKTDKYEINSTLERKGFVARVMVSLHV